MNPNPCHGILMESYNCNHLRLGGIPAHHAPVIILLVVVVHLTRNYLTPKVSTVPGPFLARLSNLWRFINVANGHAEVTLYKLYQKYGDYVRLRPNVVSVRHLEAIKTIYGINTGYQKVIPRRNAG